MFLLWKTVSSKSAICEYCYNFLFKMKLLQYFLTSNTSNNTDLAYLSGVYPG